MYYWINIMIFYKYKQYIIILNDYRFEKCYKLELKDILQNTIAIISYIGY